MSSAKTGIFTERMDTWVSIMVGDAPPTGVLLADGGEGRELSNEALAILQLDTVLSTVGSVVVRSRVLWMIKSENPCSFVSSAERRSAKSCMHSCSDLGRPVYVTQYWSSATCRI